MWHNTTNLHPLGLAFTLALGVGLLLAPKRYAIAPLIWLACLIPSAQRLVVFGADFDLLRILIIFAWIRVLFRSEYVGVSWNWLDAMVLAWMFFGTLVYTISNGTTSALINRCGWMFDGIGMYFYFRCVVRNWKDFDFMVWSFVIVSIPVACAFTLERVTGRNIFSVFGGVPEITDVRDGRLRCQGAFSHPILAGCFWVGVMPWVIASLSREPNWKKWAALGAILVVVVNCASSTPVLAIVFMAIGILTFYIRHYVKYLKWGMVVSLVFLHFFTNGPAWSYIARVNVVGGSTGWHRYKIMDATIENFSKWWLLGEKNPMEWGVSQMRDITNQYILEALRGGLITLICFVLIFVLAFRYVGKAVRLEDDRVLAFAIWSLGASLFTHACIFFSVSYFGQTTMLLYLNLALIGSLTAIHITKVSHSEAFRRN